MVELLGEENLVSMGEFVVAAAKLLRLCGKRRLELGEARNLKSKGGGSRRKGQTWNVLEKVLARHGAPRNSS